MTEGVKCPKCGNLMKLDSIIMGSDKIYEKYKCNCGTSKIELIIWTGYEWKKLKRGDE